MGVFIPPFGVPFDTYVVKLSNVEDFFTANTGERMTKSWNRAYTAAANIFDDGVKSKIAKSMAHAVHGRLYVSTTFVPVEEVKLASGDDFLKMIKYGKKEDSLIPFTYVIMPSGLMKFSETYHSIKGDVLPSARDFMSKHAVMANAEEEVLYAGEFEVVERNGDYILVIDNGSGTYAPGDNHGELNRLKSLLQRNFPGLKVIAKLYTDPLTEELMQKALRGE